MNLMTLNIRGLGEKHKQDWVSKLRLEQNLSFMAIQETHLEDDINLDFVIKCWGTRNCDFDFVNSTGRSGGIISVWDTAVFSVSKSIKSRSFLILIGKWINISGVTAIVNVYGPQSRGDKKRLWE